MDIDNFEWWYSEGEAPDEEWDEPLTSDESSDGADAEGAAGADAEAAGDATAESDDAASDPAEPAGRYVDLAGQDAATAP